MLKTTIQIEELEKKAKIPWGYSTTTVTNRHVATKK
jgi:hypothetical protein